jgi:hyperosmotically inducible periplasmic protein
MSGHHMLSLTRFRPLLLAVVIAGAGLLGVSSASYAQDKSHRGSRTNVDLQQEVYHQLKLLPVLSVFDNLQFQIHGDSVTLMGQVTQPYIKDDAEKAVKGIEGVSSVTDNIEVLPNSPDDAQIRRAEFHAIYGDPNLELYATSTEQAIHIIVKGGHVTLLGFVDNAMDKQIIQTRALSVPTVFGVDNQLQIQPRT